MDGSNEEDLNNRKEGFNYGKIEFPTLDEKIDYFETRIHNINAAKYIKKDIYSINIGGDTNYSQNLKCLKLISKIFAVDKHYPYKPETYDHEATQLTSELLHTLVRADSDTAEPRYKYNYFNRLNANVYWRHAESMINTVNKTFKEDRKNSKMLLFSECYRDIATRLLDWMVPLHKGKIMVMEKGVGHHKPSVIITPENPKNAVAALFGDKARILFAEYDEKESAETMVNELYGTDGVYANHYRKLLDLQKRYPGQKSLLHNKI